MIDRPARAGASRPSYGQLYDRLLDDDALRSWLAAQPADSWREADIFLLQSDLRFKAVTTGYERALTAHARPDGSDVRVRLPGSADRTRTFESRPATRPNGVRLEKAAGDWKLTRDVLAGRVELPSGRIVTDGFPGSHSRPLDHKVVPGAYPAYVTLARPAKGRFERVALATLVLSDHEPVRWRKIGDIGVDGGVAAFTSVEGARALDKRLGTANGDEDYDSLTAHDYHVTELPIGGRLNQVLFSTGFGDGGYPILLGLDAAGHPARFVLDFFVVHLAWPGRPPS